MLDAGTSTSSIFIEAKKLTKIFVLFKGHLIETFRCNIFLIYFTDLKTGTVFTLWLTSLAFWLIIHPEFCVLP